MAWLWTDDLARLLLSEGVEGSLVEAWLRRPVAVSAPEDCDPSGLARRLLGLPPREDDVAGAA